MSSHHIIKDNQEPAILIITKIREEIFDQLLEWSPKVFCDFEQLDWVIDKGFKIDAIFGPKSSEAASLNKMEYQMPLQYHSYQHNWTELLNKISNPTIHVASNKDIDIKNIRSASEIIRYSDDFKSYAFSGEWRKWKNQGDEIELSTSPQEMLNLKRNKSKFVVKKDGMVKINTSTTSIIKEFYVL